jgi:hypothetical protein
VAARSVPTQVNSGYCLQPGGGTSIYQDLAQAETAEAEGGGGAGFAYWFVTGSTAVLEATPWVMFATGVAYILYELLPSEVSYNSVKPWRETHWL